MLLLTVLLVLLVQLSSNVQADCNVCQVNGVACINSTSFYFCFGATVPNYDALYHCKPGFDCTDLNAICVQSNAARPPSCGDTSLCGLCSAHRNYMFACMSRSTFRFCYGAVHPQSELGYCPDGFVCDASSDNVCVRSDKAESVTCDVQGGTSEYTSTTEVTTTTVTTTTYPTTAGPATAQAMCDVQQTVGAYPISGDTTCVEYIRCYRQNGLIMGEIATCPSGTYFNTMSAGCVLAKPNNCV